MKSMEKPVKDFHGNNNIIINIIVIIIMIINLITITIVIINVIVIPMKSLYMFIHTLHLPIILYLITCSFPL